MGAVRYQHSSSHCYSTCSSGSYLGIGQMLHRLILPLLVDPQTDRLNFCGYNMYLQSQKTGNHSTGKGSVVKLMSVEDRTFLFP